MSRMVQESDGYGHEHTANTSAALDDDKDNDTDKPKLSPCAESDLIQMVTNISYNG